MKNFFLISACLVLSCSQLLFTNQAIASQLQGKIVDMQDNAPLSFCSVALTHKATGKQMGTDANLDGKFIFPYINSGEYVLSFIYGGYKTIDIDLVITDKGSTLDVGTIKMYQEKSIIAKAQKKVSKASSSPTHTTTMSTYE